MKCFDSKSEIKTIEVSFDLPEDKFAYQSLKQMKTGERHAIYRRMEKLLRDDDFMGRRIPIGVKSALLVETEQTTEILRIRLGYKKYPKLLKIWGEYPHGSRSLVFKFLLTHVLSELYGGLK